MRYAIKRILKHVLIFALILTALLIAVTFSLRSYTQHDSVIVVPDVTTLTVDEASPFIDKKGLRYKIVDSIRVSTARPGVILEQKPLPGSRVKQNRFIFLTINATSEEKIIFPDVKDFSQRQAVATLEANGIHVGSIEFMPSEYRDLVLGVRYQGRNIPAGFRLPKNSSVTLVVGQGATVGEITVPSLHGCYMLEANERAHASSLNIGNIYYDVTPVNSDAAKKYKIYRQVPITGSSASVGKNIDVWMTTDENILQEPDEVFVPEDTVGTNN
ncbi:MAG TPA: PASTA domain-containing protein [Bacteroidales bacterium]|nr:PASTA domain-containing protein [Bacteroidales bacterium]